MNELIKRYKETKNEELFEEILNKNRGLVYKIIGKYKENSLYSYDDMYQICMLSLIKAIENYDENKNIKFSTYFYKLMNGDLIVELCVNQNRKKRKADVTSLDEKIKESESNSRTIKETIIDENSNVEEEVVLKSIHEFSNECLKYYKEKYEEKYMAIELLLQGYSSRSASALLPYSRQTVNNYWKHFSEYIRQKAIIEGIL